MFVRQLDVRGRIDQRGEFGLVAELLLEPDPLDEGFAVWAASGDLGSPFESGRDGAAKLVEELVAFGRFSHR